MCSMDQYSCCLPHIPHAPTLGSPAVCDHVWFNAILTSPADSPYGLQSRMACTFKVDLRVLD